MNFSEKKIKQSAPKSRGQNHKHHPEPIRFPPEWMEKFHRGERESPRNNPNPFMSHPGWFDADSKQEVKAIHTTTNIANDLYFICRKFRSILPPPPFLSLPQSRFHAIICPNMVQARLLTGNPLPLQNINRCERVVNALRITITQYLPIARSQTDDAVMKVSGGGSETRSISYSWSIWNYVFK